mmetsp:Transcript_52262/g.144729  ORF Transcript_52262/g.144729 Transcript_52262/m.144729 type:complete len:326 (-) Transcript_52262:409-1386(-)
MPCQGLRLVGVVHQAQRGGRETHHQQRPHRCLPAQPAHPQEEEPRECRRHGDESADLHRTVHRLQGAELACEGSSEGTGSNDERNDPAPPPRLAAAPGGLPMLDRSNHGLEDDGVHRQGGHHHARTGKVPTGVLREVEHHVRLHAGAEGEVGCNSEPGEKQCQEAEGHNDRFVETPRAPVLQLLVHRLYTHLDDGALHERAEECHHPRPGPHDAAARGHAAAGEERKDEEEHVHVHGDAQARGEGQAGLVQEAEGQDRARPCGHEERPDVRLCGTRLRAQAQRHKWLQRVRDHHHVADQAEEDRGPRERVAEGLGEETVAAGQVG